MTRAPFCLASSTEPRQAGVVTRIDDAGVVGIAGQRRIHAAHVGRDRLRQRVGARGGRKHVVRRHAGCPALSSFPAASRVAGGEVGAVVHQRRRFAAELERHLA